MPRVPAGQERTKAEDCPSLDVSYLYRQGLLHVNRSFAVTCPASEGRSIVRVAIAVDHDEIVLSFGNTRQCIPITWQPLYRAFRPWFRCSRPGTDGKICRRRARKLYLRGDYFGCRACLDLVYRSQSQNARLRAGIKAQRIRRQLGGSLDLLDLFPARAKHKHVATYLRQLEQAQRAAQRWGGSTMRPKEVRNG
jgi:hypothetical protein